MLYEMSELISKKRLLRGVGALALTAILWMAPVQAQAQLVVDSPNADIEENMTVAETTATAASTSAMSITSAAEFVWAKLQAALTAASDSFNHAIDAVISTMNTDTLSTNGKIQGEANATMKVGIDHAMPPSYSFCAFAQASNAQVEVEGQTNAVAAGFSTPVRTPSASSNATDISTEMALGLAPCSTPTDPEYAQFQQLKCTQQFGGHFERADRTINAMFAAYEFPVPPTFTLPKNGVYAPLKPVTDEKYMPFIAAFMFCQHLLPRTQVPTSTGTQATIDVLSAGARADQEARSSTAYSMCMADLAERMQYDSSNPAFKVNHQSQADSCTADTNAGIMDSNTCATDGRSDLQGMHDRAYRDGTTSYHAKFLQGASRDTVIAETAQLANGKIAFRDYVMKEREALAAAMSACNAAGSVGSSPLSLPVTASPGS